MLASQLIRLDAAADPVPSLVFLNDGQFCHAQPWRGSGLAMPVFSMRTKKSVGCGEFLDLKSMVKFVAACGMRVLQVWCINRIAASRAATAHLSYLHQRAHDGLPLPPLSLLSRTKVTAYTSVTQIDMQCQTVFQPDATLCAHICNTLHQQIAPIVLQRQGYGCTRCMVSPCQVFSLVFSQAALCVHAGAASQ